MWSDIVFTDEFSSLRCAKTMLFVYYNQCQIFKFHSFLNEGMSAYQNRYFSICYPFQKLCPRNRGPVYPGQTGGADCFRWKFSATAPCDEPYADRKFSARGGSVFGGKVLYKRFKMLSCQYFRRRHICHLEVSETLPIWTLLNCHIARSGGDGSFSTSYVAFEKPRHREISPHIFQYCFN